MTLFRGYGSDLPLMEWLEQKIWPAEARLDGRRRVLGDAARVLRDDPHRHGPLLGHVLAPERGRARGPSTPGIRATVGLPLIDGLDPARGAALRDDALRSLDELADAGPLVTPSLTPHGIYTVSEQSLAWVSEQASERSLPVHLHFLEIEDEVTGLPRPDRRAAGGVPRPPRPPGADDRPRPRRVVGGRRSRPRRGARRDRRHEPRLEPEARGRPRVPVRARPCPGHPGRARDRRRIVEQSPRPAPGREGVLAHPEARPARPDRGAGGRGLGARDRCARARARRLAHVGGRGRRRLPARAARRERARAGAPHGEPRVLRVRCGRRRDRRRGPGARCASAGSKARTRCGPSHGRPPRVWASSRRES